MCELDGFAQIKGIQPNTIDWVCFGMNFFGIFMRLLIWIESLSKEGIREFEIFHQSSY